VRAYVVNQQLAEKFREALNRGVSIYIETGHRRSDQIKQEDDGSIKYAKSILRSLADEFNNNRGDKEFYMGKLYVGDVPTHIKEVVVDGDYYLAGSNNWLANRDHSNLEASHAIYNKVLAREVRDETITSVLTNPSTDIHGPDLT
jgi:phosphatidylserine/phosphatidylglycerophosphate/cardiolipin synthase-like enzyme